MCKTGFVAMVLGRFANSSSAPATTAAAKQHTNAPSSTATSVERLVDSVGAITQVPAAVITAEAAAPPPSVFESRRWTEVLSPTEHVQFFKSVDWAGSHLGALEGWSTGLRIHISTLLSDSRPAVVYW